MGGEIASSVGAGITGKTAVTGKVVSNKNNIPTSSRIHPSSTPNTTSGGTPTHTVSNNGKYSPINGGKIPANVSVDFNKNLPVHYPHGIHFSSSLQNHMSEVEGFVRNKGFVGGHNRDNFQSALLSKGGRIISETPTNRQGVTQIRYEVPVIDRKTGQIIRYRQPSRHPKTVYDPTKISDSQMLRMGQEAAAKGYQRALRNGLNRDNWQYTETINGIDFRIYLDPITKEVRNVHPK